MNEGINQGREIRSKLHDLNGWVNKVEATLRYIKKHYPEYEMAFFYYEKLISRYFNHSNNVFDKKIFLLDAGCGWKNREVSKYLNDNIQAIGVDIDNDALKNNITYENLILCNLEYMPFKEKTFDLITNICVLEHIEHPTKVFGEFHRITKERGNLIFLLPNLINPLMFFGKITPTKLHKKFMSRLLGRDEEDIFPTFFSCNTENTLEILASKFGFRRKYLIKCGDFSIFIFSRFLIHCWIIFDNLTNIGVLKRFKMLIIVNYEKR